MISNSNTTPKKGIVRTGTRRAQKHPIRPILLKRLHLRCGDWTVRELRVNRHLQPFDQDQPHHHSHGQLLLYLRGRGEQRIAKRRLPVGPGAVFFIPPGTKHSFLEHSPRLAICLVADLSGTGPKQFGIASGWLPAEELARVRERINKLSHENPEKQSSPRSLELGAGGDTLLLLDSCRRACMALSPAASEGSAISKRLIRAIDPGGLPPMPGELARRVGLQQDHLNRLVRRSIGLTLGQWRDRELLKATEEILSQGGRIQAAAMKLGFSDANYFSRWFRRQTGMTPRSWQTRPLPGMPATSLAALQEPR
ncbi:MAG: AraC family transcriptional regulator [bacterium]